MVDEQTRRAIETMALCGCEVDSLYSMFPKVDKADITGIWNDTAASKKDMQGEDDTPNISCNCS